MAPLLTADRFEKLYQDILNLRQTFLLPVEIKRPLNEEERAQHEKIFRSELKELVQASTRVLQLDGFVDAVVTLMGRVVHHGLSDLAHLYSYMPGEAFFIEEMLVGAEINKMNFWGGWDEIQTSNLSKVCKDAETRDLTISHYQTLGVPVYAEQTPTGGFVIKVAEETSIQNELYPKGKFLKAVDYQKPNLKPFV